MQGTSVKYQELEHKFNDFLKNISKKIKGVYEIDVISTEISFIYAPIRGKIEVFKP